MMKNICSKCGGLMRSLSEDSICMNCGYSPTVVSADVAAEVEQSLNRKRLKNHAVQLPSLTKSKFLPF